MTPCLKNKTKQPKNLDDLIVSRIAWIMLFRNDYCCVWYRYVWIHAFPCAWKPKATIWLGLSASVPKTRFHCTCEQAPLPHKVLCEAVQAELLGTTLYVRWDCWGDSLRGTQTPWQQNPPLWWCKYVSLCFPGTGLSSPFYLSFSCFFVLMAVFVRTAVSSYCKWFGCISLVQIYNPRFQCSNLKVEWQFV